VPRPGRDGSRSRRCGSSCRGRRRRARCGPRRGRAGRRGRPGTRRALGAAAGPGVRQPPAAAVRQPLDPERQGGRRRGQHRGGAVGVDRLGPAASPSWPATAGIAPPRRRTPDRHPRPATVRGPAATGIGPRRRGRCGRVLGPTGQPTRRRGAAAPPGSAGRTPLPWAWLTRPPGDRGLALCLPLTEREPLLSGGLVSPSTMAWRSGSVNGVAHSPVDGLGTTPAALLTACGRPWGQPAVPLGTTAQAARFFAAATCSEPASALWKAKFFNSDTVSRPRAILPHREHASIGRFARSGRG
jgi:hypothetical protein